MSANLAAFLADLPRGVTVAEVAKSRAETVERVFGEDDFDPKRDPIWPLVDLDNN